MKRHLALVPLSREHHNGLVIAQRLILGRSTNPRSPWPSAVQGQAERLRLFFHKELQPHLFISVPRIYEKIYSNLTAAIESKAILKIGLKIPGLASVFK